MMTLLRKIYEQTTRSLLLSARHILDRLTSDKPEHRNPVDTTVWVRQADGQMATAADSGPVLPRTDPDIRGCDASSTDNTAWSGRELERIASLLPDSTMLADDGGPVSKASLQEWISAGVLYPEEIIAAEKVIRGIQRSEAGSI